MRHAARWSLSTFNRHHVWDQDRFFKITAAHKISDGEHFTIFSLWDSMNFTRDCKAYGNWYSTFSEPNPWNKSHYLDGDASLLVKYFNTSLPQNWTRPENGTDGDYVGKVLEWYGWNLGTNY